MKISTNNANRAPSASTNIVTPEMPSYWAIRGPFAMQSILKIGIIKTVLNRKRNIPTIGVNILVEELTYLVQPEYFPTIMAITKMMTITENTV